MSHKPLTQQELKAILEQEIKESGKLFREIDKDESHSLTLDEVKVALAERQDKVAGSKQKQAEADAIRDFYRVVIEKFETLDRNHDKTLSYIEFMLGFDKAKDAILGRN